jgi:hypothetical protein
VSGGEQIDCGIHGLQPLAIACGHIAQGLLDGATPGFVCYPEGGEAYPLAWCDACEVAVEAMGGDWNKEAASRADFKMLCASCYLEARDLASDGGRLRVH